MKAVLMSIQPKWCELIASGKKTVEVRKTKPKLETPFKVYIYETNGKDNTYWKNHHKGRLGKVIGEFVCDSLIWVVAHPDIFAGHPLYYSQAIVDACLTQDEVEKYSGGKDVYGYHISDLVIYDEPKELSEFKQVRVIRGYHKKGESQIEKLLNSSRVEVRYLTRPPQSWCYVEELKGE